MTGSIAIPSRHSEVKLEMLFGETCPAVVSYISICPDASDKAGKSGVAPRTPGLPSHQVLQKDFSPARDIQFVRMTRKIVLVPGVRGSGAKKPGEQSR